MPVKPKCTECETLLPSHDILLCTYHSTRPILHRGDGRVEWMCSHGVGHTVGVIPGKFNIESWGKSWGIHGCDGCCGYGTRGRHGS